MIRIFNTKQAYGIIAIAMHWLMAIGLFFMFGLGLYMIELTYYDSWYHGSLALHKSIGCTLFAGLALRFLWGFFNVTPVALSTNQYQIRVAAITHHLLYLLPFLLMLSGYLISTADGKGISIFNFVTIPALPFSIDNQEDVAGDIHAMLAWALMALVALHVLAAIKHHVINKDKTLIRILKTRE